VIRSLKRKKGYIEERKVKTSLGGGIKANFPHAVAVAGEMEET